MKYLAYLNILFGDNHVQNSGNCKKGEFPEDHLGFKNRDKKIPVLLISTKNVTVKNRHIHRHHCTKLYKMLPSDF